MRSCSPPSDKPTLATVKPEDVEARLRTGEDSRTEFKSARALPSGDDVAKEVVAFANSGGGDILFGVSDAPAIEGVGDVKDAERLQRFIVQTCADSVTPPIRVTTRVIEVGSELVVVAQVPGYLPNRPFRGRTKYFVRDGNVSREARPDELRRALVSGGFQYFDEQPAQGAETTSLDTNLVDEFLSTAVSASAIPRERVLRELKVQDAEGTPTFAGLLMFAADPQVYLPDAYVSIVKFGGTRLGDRRTDAKELRGPLLHQLDRTVEYLGLHVESEVEIEGALRKQRLVPTEVWREAIANALCHRDYQVAAQTRVFVLDDRVEIANPGELLNRLTVEGIRLGGIPQRRNPYLTTLVARARRRESWGIGVPRMIELIREAGLPTPEIRVEFGEFRLIVWTRPQP
ncbi:MAG: putative DNA binding domain-containing protein [Myxococcales bacterium]|nr:putative DNA binding domain-containing protein [Myxococcales bacterium]